MAVMNSPLRRPAACEVHDNLSITGMRHVILRRGPVRKFVTVYAIIGFCPHSERRRAFIPYPVSRKRRTPVVIAAIPDVVRR